MWFLLPVTENYANSDLCFQMLSKSCAISCIFFVVNTTHLLLQTNARDPDLTRICGAMTLLCLVSCSESSIRLDSGVKAEAPGPLPSLTELLKTSTHTQSSGFQLGRHRYKRSVFLHSGVKICPQETINEVVASHQAYYQLRGIGLVFFVFFTVKTSARYHSTDITCTFIQCSFRRSHRAHSALQPVCTSAVLSYLLPFLTFPAFHGFTR